MKIYYVWYNNINNSNSDKFKFLWNMNKKFYYLHCMFDFCASTIWGDKLICGDKTCCEVQLWGVDNCGDNVNEVSGELCKILSLLFFFFQTWYRITCDQNYMVDQSDKLQGVSSEL